ncbi:MAG: hypothetical protein U0031_20715 [Thermomicrobiales bacterium]
MSNRAITTAILIALLVGACLLPAAAYARPGLHDRQYISPTWGYVVRWYSDEWTIDDQASNDGIDTLALSDGEGRRVAFAGRAGYGGDARACLDDQIAAIESSPDASDLAVVRDEFDHPQKFYHPWRAWIMLLAGRAEGGARVDHVVYLDCRTLAPDDAVLIRTLEMPATAWSDELWPLDVLNAALPRGAWWGGVYSALSAPGLDADFAPPPLPTDSLLPWDYPDAPHLLPGAMGAERGMLTQIDGDNDAREFVVLVENMSEEPLTIDPARFTDSNRPEAARPDPDIAPLSAVWDDTGQSGPRTLDAGTTATLTLTFPPLPAPRAQASFLLYWDGAAEYGAVVLDCVANCGYGGVGSRPRLRISR